VGLLEVECPDESSLARFFETCCNNRSTSSTKLNDASSRSHALFTININRTMVRGSPLCAAGGRAEGLALSARDAIP